LGLSSEAGLVVEEPGISVGEALFQGDGRGPAQGFEMSDNGAAYHAAVSGYKYFHGGPALLSLLGGWVLGVWSRFSFVRKLWGRE
jgi:hypothetical protein